MYQPYDQSYELAAERERALEALAGERHQHLMKTPGEITGAIYDDGEEVDMEAALATLLEKWKSWDKAEIIKAADRLCSLLDEKADRMAYQQAEEEVA